MPPSGSGISSLPVTSHRETLTSAASSTCAPTTSEATRQCHFFAGIGGWSVALRLAGWPDERPVWTGSCPCQPFSPPARARQAMTNATCGLRGHLSSASAALEQSLVSRLKRRLDGAGSTLFSLTWKRKATPAGRPYYQLAASARRTSETGFGLSPKAWTTPTAGNACGANKAREGGTSLNSDALLAAWPTPDAAAAAATRRGRAPRSGTVKHGQRLRDDAGQAAHARGVADARGRDVAQRATTKRGTTGTQPQATLAGWATPREGWEGRERDGTRRSGNGTTPVAPMRRKSPAAWHSAWLMAPRGANAYNEAGNNDSAQAWRWLLVRRRVAPLLRRKSPAN
jgi:hypothetical protein